MMDWQAYIHIGDSFQHKARFQDRQDLSHDIILRCAEVAAKRNEDLTEGQMVRIASYVTMHYWDDQKRVLTFLSLNEDIEDDEGDTIQLWETLADDKAIDLEAWQDSKRWLLGCPRRLVKIAYKKVLGKPLNEKEQKYLERYRQKQSASRQKPLL